jgi:hypothetical protein
LWDTPNKELFNNSTFAFIAMQGGTTASEERRKHPRISIRTELWIGQDGIFTRTNEYLRDLSIGGAFVQCEQVHPIGAILSFRFKVPGATNLVSCSAIVRNMRLGDGFGVQFLDLSREQVGLIERHIESETQPQYT